MSDLNYKPFFIILNQICAVKTLLSHHKSICSLQLCPSSQDMEVLFENFRKIQSCSQESGL